MVAVDQVVYIAIPGAVALAVIGVIAGYLRERARRRPPENL